MESNINVTPNYNKHTTRWTYTRLRNTINNHTIPLNSATLYDNAQLLYKYEMEEWTVQPKRQSQLPEAQED